MGGVRTQGLSDTLDVRLAGYGDAVENLLCESDQLLHSIRLLAAGPHGLVAALSLAGGQPAGSCRPVSEIWTPTRCRSRVNAKVDLCEICKRCS